MTHPIPTAALDDRLAFVGNAGSGKTYAAGTAVERLLDSGARVVIPDPLGVWWGLALSKDGKSPSKFRRDEKLVIFGGPRGDLGLTEHSGALIGETVAGMAESCILDLSELKTGAAERRFMLAFLSALYKHKTREPLHTVFDEADMWAPQRILDREGEAMKLLGMMETICRRGRVKGFIPWLISQRPAVISKNVLSQIDGMIALKLTSVQDRDAIGDWVQGQADTAQWKAMWGQMATMPQGQGVVWLPARGVLKTAQFPEKVTFDSSRAPKRGERMASAKALTPVNLDKLKERLATVEAESKANDPAKLKAELAKVKNDKAQLERQMAAAVQSKVVTDPDAIKKAEQRGFEQAKKKLTASATRTVNDIVRATVTKLLGVEIALEPSTPAPTVPRAAPSVPARRPSDAKTATPPGDGTYTRPQMRVLRSLAMWKSLGHDAPSREMVAAVAGYSPNSSTYSNLISSLRTIGAVDYPSQGQLSTTVNGIEVMAPEEGRDLLIENLSNPQKKIVAALLDRGTRSREDVANDTGYSATSSTFSNLVSSVRTLQIIDYPQQGFLSLAGWAQELLSGYELRIAA